VRAHLHRLRDGQERRRDARHPPRPPRQRPSDGARGRRRGAAQDHPSASGEAPRPMSAITTQVLDTSLGRPAGDLEVTLEVHAGDGYRPIGRGATDADGRLRTLLPTGERLVAGSYRITFQVRDPDQHFHVPLLLSPFGYSTYRGS